MRVISLVVFVVIGALVAFLTRASSLNPIVGYLIAFLAALAAAFFIERLVAARTKRPVETNKR
ncbi:MAG: hypothetical protein AB1762_10960 [Gemmatimonadota bacterium]